MNMNNTPTLGKLTGEDLDRIRRQKEFEAIFLAPIESKSARSQMRAAEKEPFPGCGGSCGQGRQECDCDRQSDAQDAAAPVSASASDAAPQAAEACTEAGFEDEPTTPPATRLGLLICALSAALVFYGLTSAIRHIAG